MKKERLLLSFLVLLIGSFCFNALAYSDGELFSIARHASKIAAQKMSAKVSPNIYDNPDYDIDSGTIKYNTEAQKLEFHVKLSWSAKNQLFFGTRDICETWGKMYVDLSNGTNEMKARFVPEGKNHWCEVCEKTHNLDILDEVLIFIISN